MVFVYTTQQYLNRHLLVWQVLLKYVTYILPNFRPSFSFLTALIFGHGGLYIRLFKAPRPFMPAYAQYGESRRYEFVISLCACIRCILYVLFAIFPTASCTFKDFILSSVIHIAISISYSYSAIIYFHLQVHIILFNAHSRCVPFSSFLFSLCMDE